MEKFLHQIRSPDYKEFNPWWITGFSDGESWFRMYKINRGTSWTFSFGIKLRDDDELIIEAIRDVFDGSLYRGHQSEEKRKQYGREGAKPSVMVVLHKRESIGQLIWHFDHYPLQTKKAGDYYIWREAAVTWYGAPTAMEVGEIRYVPGKMQGMYRKKSSECCKLVADLAVKLKQNREYSSPRTFKL